VRERYGKGTWRTASDWPVPETRYEKLHLDVATGTLSKIPPERASAITYSTDAGAEPHRATFDHRFAEATDLVGHMKLAVTLSADDAEDMDVFVAVQKLDADGNIVPFAYYAQFEDGPVALGWLRASHRELDPERSTPHQPVLLHRRAQPMPKGEPVPLEIEIWPSGTRFEKGEVLRLVIQGRDIYDYPKPSVYARHENLVNAGRHTIHTGSGREGFLLVPVVPTENSGGEALGE
jgi:predicted acyl esterase